MRFRTTAIPPARRWRHLASAPTAAGARFYDVATYGARRWLLGARRWQNTAGRRTQPRGAMPTYIMGCEPVRRFTETHPMAEFGAAAAALPEMYDSGHPCASTSPAYRRCSA